jgi:Response regulator receiver domain
MMTTVVVVEDEILVRIAICEDLTAEGYEVLTADNADQAIEILESRNDITTIFTDIEMPGSMNGLKLAAAVRDLRRIGVPELAGMAGRSGGGGGRRSNKGGPAKAACQSPDSIGSMTICSLRMLISHLVICVDSPSFTQTRAEQKTAFGNLPRSSTKKAPTGCGPHHLTG